MLNIEEPQPAKPGYALFNLGFRPFFLLAGLSALLLIGLWIPVFSGQLRINPYFHPIYWHAHEMLYGYSLAVIAGFLLTAVPNWTQYPTPKGIGLAVLALCWLAGRLVCTLPLGLPPMVIALIDLSFIPLLIVGLSGPLLRARKARNIVFLLILSLFFISNSLMHAEALDFQPLGKDGINLALNLVLLMIVMIGGRVTPFFTRNALGIEPRINPWLEKAAIFSIPCLIALELFSAPNQLIALCALFAGILHFARLLGWSSQGIWRHSLLWVLHLGYGCLALSLILRAGLPLGLYPPSAAIHCFTVGGIGLMTLGMMSRIALGHSGRLLELPKMTRWGIFVLSLAAITRVLASLNLFSQNYLMLIQLAAGLWVLAFAFFVINFAPICWRPRADGRPG